MHKSEISAPPAKCVFSAAISVEAGQCCFLHSHACTELIWYRGCRGWLPQGRERFRYVDGLMAVYQPGVLHGDECEKRGVQVCLGVMGGGVGELPAGVWPVNPSIRSALTAIRGLLDQHDDLRQQRLDLVCSWLVLELRLYHGAKDITAPREPVHVTAARRIFDTRFMEPLSVAGIADDLSIGPDYLRQLFLKATGETPIQYLIRKRLECACDLLRLNQEDTWKIAERAGIANPYYFSRLFRNRFGITPTQYRARYASSPASEGKGRGSRSGRVVVKPGRSG